MPEDPALQENHNLHLASNIGITIIVLRRAEIANVNVAGEHRNLSVGVIAPLKYQASAAVKGQADLEDRVPPFEEGFVHTITTRHYLNRSESTYPIGSV